KLVSGIGNQRGSRIAYQRDRLGCHQRQQPFTPLLSCMVVITDHALLKAEVIEQPCRYPRIFASNGRHTAQDINRTQSDVAEIANRRSDNLESGLKQLVHPANSWTAFKGAASDDRCESQSA